MVGETYHPKLAWTGFNLQSIDCVTDDVGATVLVITSQVIKTLLITTLLITGQ